MSGIIGGAGSRSGVIGKSEDTAFAWVSFNGKGTGPTGWIYSSYNISSVTDRGIGMYTGVFTAKPKDAHYVVTVSGSDLYLGSVSLIHYPDAPTTTEFDVQMYTNKGSYGTNTLDDPTFVSILVHGG
jgi:hypothetical protein